MEWGWPRKGKSASWRPPHPSSLWHTSQVLHPTCYWNLQVRQGTCLWHTCHLYFLLHPGLFHLLPPLSAIFLSSSFVCIPSDMQAWFSWHPPPSFSSFTCCTSLDKSTERRSDPKSLPQPFSNCSPLVFSMRIIVYCTRASMHTFNPFSFAVSTISSIWRAQHAPKQVTQSTKAYDPKHQSIWPRAPDVYQVPRQWPTEYGFCTAGLKCFPSFNSH